MPWAAALLLLALGSAMADPLTEAEARFRALETYRVTVRTLATDGERQVIRYYFRKPGWVRIETVSPHPGAVLIYEPEQARNASADTAAALDIPTPVKMAIMCADIPALRNCTRPAPIA